MRKSDQVVLGLLEGPFARLSERGRDLFNYFDDPQGDFRGFLVAAWERKAACYGVRLDTVELL